MRILHLQGLVDRLTTTQTLGLLSGVRFYQLESYAPSVGRVPMMSRIWFYFPGTVCRRLCLFSWYRYGWSSLDDPGSYVQRTRSTPWCVMCEFSLAQALNLLC